MDASSHAAPKSVERVPVFNGGRSSATLDSRLRFCRRRARGARPSIFLNDFGFFVTVYFARRALSHGLRRYRDKTTRRVRAGYQLAREDRLPAADHLAASPPNLFLASRCAKLSAHQQSRSASRPPLFLPRPSPNPLAQLRHPVFWTIRPTRS